MTNRNFLLGKGERLVEEVTLKFGGSPKDRPYSVAEACHRLAPRLTRAVEALDALPDGACPEDRAVATVTLHPDFIAKSDYPKALFDGVGVVPIGSRPRRITPEKRSRERVPEPADTTQFFVHGKRAAFRAWCDVLPQWSERTSLGAALTMIEDIAAPAVTDKIKGPLPDQENAVVEVVVHANAWMAESRVLHQLKSYLGTLGISWENPRRFFADNLCFLELTVPVALAEDIARFSLVRVLRPMPSLRALRPMVRTGPMPVQTVVLPTEPPLDPKTRIAVFDGGLPDHHLFSSWVVALETEALGPAVEDYCSHGLSVTSAVLFGAIDPRRPIPRPYAAVDHYRVLDDTPGEATLELYDVLARIEAVLTCRSYPFVNLSLGPRLPIDDDEVHAWTAVLDDRLSRGDTLATIAVGNDGEADAAENLNRIQVPADCVNALAVGACDSTDALWQRATYSSVGPGRSPGRVKPDLVAFGGSLHKPFLVVGTDHTETLEATGGTSFAAPSVLRMAAGIRAHMGPELGSLALRALLLHTLETNGMPVVEVGRGRLAGELDNILLCAGNTIRVVYQDKISPARAVRAPIPLPSGLITGKVTVTATLCYATPVDAHHPGTYTRATLKPIFRPHAERRKKPEQIHANSQSFFGKTYHGQTEGSLRSDAGKWEPCQHDSHVFYGSSLLRPVFDIHYMARQEGHDSRPDDPMPYALVVSVCAPSVTDLYDQVVRQYGGRLEPLQPVIETPIQV